MSQQDGVPSQQRLVGDMLAFIRFIDDHSWEETGFFAQDWSRLSFLSLPQ